MKENVIEWFQGDHKVGCTFSPGKFARRIIALNKKYPEDIDMILNKDNSVYAKIPVEYISIRKPKNGDAYGRAKTGTVRAVKTGKTEQKEGQ